MKKLEKKFGNLLQETTRLKYYKEKSEKSLKDLETSVEFMRSALFAIEREFTDETQ